MTARVEKAKKRLDGIYRNLYRQSVTLVWDTWKNNPFRIPILMILILLTVTSSASWLINPRSSINQNPPKALASTYQFVPTSGNLVVGTGQNANSLLAGATEGVNTGSWKGTLSDDNFHWQVTAADAATPNLNMQLDLGIAKLAGANKLIIQTEVDLDSASRVLKIQICDWVSSTSVDATTDGQCTGGGWRSLMSQNASNVDVDIALTSPAAFQWHIYDGYFSSGTGGGTAISTPLTNFTSSDTQPIRVRYWSDSDVVGSADVAVDFLRANALVDPVYQASSFTNLGVGTVTGIYANTHIVGNTATGQQNVTSADGVSIDVAGTAGSISDSYLTFKNVKTYTGMNAFYFKSEYYCSTTGINFDYAIRNFTAGTWENLTSASIACSGSAATNAWSKNNITPADYIDEASGDEVRIRMYGSANSTVTLRQDFAYLMVGSTNSDSAQCEITWGTGTATDCTNARDLIGPATAVAFANTAEDESNTVNNDYYALDNDGDATLEEATAANINFPVTVPSDAQVVANHYAGRFSGCSVCTTTALTVQMGLRDYSGTPTSTAATGGWTAVGATSATATQAYTDSITALAIGTYGNQTNPDDHIDTNNNVMNVRLRTTASGLTSNNAVTNWDFAMVSISWVVDSSHPTRNYQFAPTGDTLGAGTEIARLGQTAAVNTGVNTGGWQGTRGDDNYHWSINGANVVGTNHNMQLNFTSAKQNGANKLLIQTEFDTDAALAVKVQICDWVSSTSVDVAADGDCTTGGWRSVNSQNASNVDVDFTTNGVISLQWQIFDGYFTTGTTGGTAISTPLTNFFHASNGVKIRLYNTVQTATAIDVDFLRIQPIIDTVYHPAGVTNLNGSGGALAGTYANTHVVGNSASGQQSTTTADGVYLAGAGTAGSIADYYLSFKNIKTYAGMNTFYFKADYNCSAATAGLDHQFAIYNFTTTSWENLNSAAIACATADATNAWAKNNISPTDYINGGETRIRFYGDLNSTTTLRLDFAYLVVGSTNTDSSDCQISFGSGTASDCANTRNLVGPASPNTFDVETEDESTTMGTGDANAFYALDNESTPDTTVEEGASSNISFPVTQPSNSSIVGQHFATRFSGCGAFGNPCGATALTAQFGFKDYSGFNQATGGWLQLNPTSNSATLAYADSISNLSISVYGQQINPEDLIDTANNKMNLRLRPTTRGSAAGDVTVVWDFAMASIQWIEIGSTIDISGSSSVDASTVAVAVDGVLQVNKNATVASSAWTISSVFVGKGRVVIVWHDGASDANESTGITNYDGSGNITCMVLTAHTFSVGSADNQTKTYSELTLYDNDADEDVMYKAISNTISVDATSSYADETLDILSSNSLTVGGSETLTTLNLTVNGTLTSGGATTYNVGGNYTNNGTFTASTSTVTLNGAAAQNLSGTMTNTSAFYNLTLTNASGADATDDERTNFVAGIDFAASATVTNNYTIAVASVRVEYNTGSTYTMTNINWNGAAVGTRIFFRNSAASGSWLLNVSGTQTNVAYVNVSRSDASSGSTISAGNGTNYDGNNNTNWSFTAVITGTVYMANETTIGTSGNGGPCDGAATNVSLRVNGGAENTASCSNTTAVFSFTGLTVNSGDRVTIYLTSTMKANTVLVAQSNGAYSIDLYENRVSVTYTTGSSIVIDNLTDYDSDQNNTDMLYDAENAATDTLILESGIELHIPTSKAFAPGGAATN